jgi:hypothetical protein
MKQQETEEELLEKARKRRQAIMERYKSVTSTPDKVSNEISNSKSPEEIPSESRPVSPNGSPNT